jgi:short-subunit dehydrogenase
MADTTITDRVDSRPLALITGASSGIGLELARQFAEHGYDLLVNAEDDSINAIAAQLRATGVRVEPIQADLRHYDGVERLYGAVRAESRPLEAAALNAGVGQGGAFVDTGLDEQLEVIDVNVSGTVHLAKRLLTDMAARNQGQMLITSSIAATMPGSFQAVYNASKSFLQSFAEALQNELKDTEVSITSMMPGPTDTNFFERAGMAENTKIGQQKKDDPAQVAKQGFDALMANRDKLVVGSTKTKVQGMASKVLPDKAKAAMHRQMAEPQD